MDHYSILRNANDHLSRLQQDAAYRRLAASARTAHPATSRRGPGVRLGLALVRIGTRLQGVERAAVPDPAASLAKSR